MAFVSPRMNVCCMWLIQASRAIFASLMLPNLEAPGRAWPTAASSVTMAPGTSDGIRVDVAGNFWAAAAWGGEGFDGVHCYAPDGARSAESICRKVARISVLGVYTRHRLFMTASQSLYSVFLNVTGA